MRPLFAATLAATLSLPAHAASKISNWDQPLRGANVFSQAGIHECLADAHQKGIHFIRLAPNKWPAKGRDFLLGTADNFSKIDSTDLEAVKSVLNAADAKGMKVVLTTLSAPGARWRQQNDGREDGRLWQAEAFHTQTAAFWTQLALQLKGHPALIGYEILNEPHPEVFHGLEDFLDVDFKAWNRGLKNAAGDLNRFYSTVATAIRKVDIDTPIVVDTGFWSSPRAFPYLAPLNDDKVIYSFHMYEPFAYTNKRLNKGRFAYPGPVPLGEDPKTRRELAWDRSQLEEFLRPVVAWQTLHHIPSNRIFVGEFGVNRTNRGARQYLEDLVRIFDKRGWHWAFYAFREDTWPAMDYELGTREMGEKYWKAIARGERPSLSRADKPLFEVLLNSIRESGLE